MAHLSDEEIIRTTRNPARFFTEQRQVAWVLFVGVVIWGVYGYTTLPKQKDPTIPVRIALVTCSWPGIPATQMEQLVTRPIEQAIAENSHIHRRDPRTYGIQSLTLPGYTIIRLQLSDNVENTEEQFNDINLKLEQLNSQLPQGAGPIQFNGNFGETAALMLTVASPLEREVTLSLRAKAIVQEIDRARRAAGTGAGRRSTLVVVFPWSVDENVVARRLALVSAALNERGLASDIVPIAGRGFAGLDMSTSQNAAMLSQFALDFAREQLGIPGFHPDAWHPVVIEDTAKAPARLTAVNGPRFSYRELDNFTDLISRTLQTATQVSKVDRYGVLEQQIDLAYSQEQLASYGLQPAKIKQILAARNITLPGGMLDVDGMNLYVDPSGQFTSADQIGGVVIAQAQAGSPVYLRDLVEISRGYQSPPTFLNYYAARDGAGRWQRTPAITLAVQMRDGEQIADFGAAVDERLAGLASRLPEDLIVARTSDQPRQVREEIGLFMTALYEAVILVVLAALVGFWEWRSAVLMAFSIPLTLALTFGMMNALGIAVQQVSIASLIIALGLLVDDPVVAGDAIKSELAAGHKRNVAAWLGPTRLARPILFATVTNIAAYLPFLLLTGTTGDFMRSLPVVMACALIASRVVSMTFVPLLGSYLLRAGARRELSIEEKRTRGFTGRYYRLGSAMIEHRWLSLLGSFAFLALGVVLATHLKVFFFPYDREYLSYVDIWLPNNASFERTEQTARQAEEIVRRVASSYANEVTGHSDTMRGLKSVTTFIGGAGPRFWFSLTPEQRQLNYAQLILETFDKEATTELAGRWQRALSSELPGARADVRQLELNRVGVPIQVRVAARTDVSGGRSTEAITALRGFGDEIVTLLGPMTGARRTRNDWGEDSFVVRLEVDPDRANMAGLSNRDVAQSSAAGISGLQVSTLLEGDKQIPVVARLRSNERAAISNLESLYVYSSTSDVKVPLRQVSTVRHDMELERLRRLEQFHTITIEAFPAEGVLPSEIMNAVQDKLQSFAARLPSGFDVTVSGAEANRKHSFGELTTIMGVSIIAIFVLLAFQFNHAVKPLLVFAAVPYGMVGSLGALYVMGVPFGVMAFMGIISLVGVIVSHIIVLFDFIEVNREQGKPLKESLLDAGIARLRPVMITVGATVLALVPLAYHGGPLWQPLCYAQIGGLALATFIELLLVKVFYAIAVLDLKLVKWEAGKAEG